jgi:endonuclease/exonuclease/phosphatase family metal-dependent hydrolase
MKTLARVVRQFDIVAVQEFRDATETVPHVFLDRINQDSGAAYTMVVGPRLGRTDSKEQYAIYFRPDRVTYVDGYTVPNQGYRFERPPMVATFRAGKFDFRLVVSHIRPDDANRELAALARVAAAVTDSTEQDVILLGDFNADCTYFNENDDRHPLRNTAFHWVIGNEAETAVRTGCSYDRIILLDGTFEHEYVANSAQVFRYDGAFGIRSRTTVRNVSDHFPVFAEFRIGGPDDDGCRRPTPALVGSRLSPDPSPLPAVAERGTTEVGPC